MLQKYKNCVLQHLMLTLWSLIFHVNVKGNVIAEISFCSVLFNLLQNAIQINFYYLFSAVIKTDFITTLPVENRVFSTDKHRICIIFKI